MTGFYTPNLLKSFQSNLHIHIGTDINSDPAHLSHLEDQAVRARTHGKYDKYYFQIIEVDADRNIRLVYGTKEALEKKYSLNSRYLPTSGSKVDTAFVPVISDSQTKDPLRTAQHSTVRFLLQCRKLSQLVTSAWLDDDQIPENKSDKIQTLKKILASYNIIPKAALLNADGQEVPKLNLSGLPEPSEIEGKISEINGENKYLSDYLIKSTHKSFSSISLSLLLCGQVCYSRKNDDNQWTMIEPIFSTYEMVQEYALDVSWDTFYATRSDISHAGGTPTPPYTHVTLGIPPKPNEFSLGKKQIEEWVTAKDYDKKDYDEKDNDEQDNDEQDNQYPFYPPKDSDDWKTQQLKFVVPPFPYIPLSTV